MEFRLTMHCHDPEEHILTFKQPMFAYANALKRISPIEIHFMYLGHKIFSAFLRQAE